MAYNPRFKITIEYKEGNEEWIEIMKQEFKDRLINQRKLYDFFQYSKKKKQKKTWSLSSVHTIMLSKKSMKKK